MVGRDISGIADGSGSRIPRKLVLDLQMVDGVGTHPGVDQHENYSGCCFLRGRHPDRDGQTLAW